MIAETSVQRSFSRAAFALDSRLRRRYGVLDYLDAPDCILRLELGRARRRIVLSDGVRLEPADRIAELHFRNEHFPAMYEGGRRSPGRDASPNGWIYPCESFADI
jgi:hypothetical protein